MGLAIHSGEAGEALVVMSEMELPISAPDGL
jgi:hypothetical protein